MAASSHPILTVTGISKAYGRQIALDDASFTIGAGEVVGLVGPNGAGKSTAMRIICGLLRADAGRVSIEGVDQREGPDTGRARVGALIEAPASYPMLSAFDHLAYVARLRGRHDPAMVERLLASVGLPPRSRKRVGQFSLGMKQRLGLAMALLDQPALLVLDEPMNGLDPVGVAELRHRLRRLADDDGVALLISSHLLHEIEQICDRVIFIQDGRIVSDVRLDATGDETVVLHVVTGQNDAAMALLQSQPFVLGAQRVGERIECRLAAADVPAVARLLVDAQIPIHALSPHRESLEQRYLAHYGANEGREGQP